MAHADIVVTVKTESALNRDNLIALMDDRFPPTDGLYGPDRGRQREAITLYIDALLVKLDEVIRADGYTDSVTGTLPVSETNQEKKE